MEKKYKIGLLVGRFQPFHNGHLYLIRKSLPLVSKFIIGIGSSNIKDSDNPLSFGQRRKMIEIVFAKEEIQKRLLKIIPVPDIPSDDDWFRIACERAGKFDVAIGNNEWVNGIFEKAGFPILRSPCYKRWILEGVKIRKAIGNNQKWETRIPHYLIKYLKKYIGKFKGKQDE